MDSSVFGKKMGFVMKLFGCRHKNLSRPFTQEKTSYRSCLNCGARKQFNPETLETYGKFYAPPVVKEALDSPEQAKKIAGNVGPKFFN